MCFQDKDFVLVTNPCCIVRFVAPLWLIMLERMIIALTLRVDFRVILLVSVRAM